MQEYFCNYFYNFFADIPCLFSGANQLLGRAGQENIGLRISPHISLYLQKTGGDFTLPNSDFILHSSYFIFQTSDFTFHTSYFIV